MKKIWFYFLLASVIAALIAIHTQIIPRYVLIHTTNDIDGAYLGQLSEAFSRPITLQNVDKLYMGWTDFGAFLAVAILVFSGPGFVMGLRQGLAGKDEELQVSLSKILSEKRVSTSGVTIGGYMAEAIETGLRKECTRIEQERKKLDEEKLSFNKEYSHFVDLRDKTTETAKQIESLKESNANRLDKIARLESTNEKLKANNLDLEKENIDLKTQNVSLAKKVLSFEVNNS